jgi:amidohydrolase
MVRHGPVAYNHKASFLSIGNAGGKGLMADWRETIDEFIDSNAERWRAIRRHLHANPEASREEFETTLFLAERLREAGVAVRIVTSGRGLIAEPEGLDDRPRVAIRADIDALRMNDAKTVAYRSTRPGVLHACGHDGHSAMALAAAAALWHARDALPRGTDWRAIFQPAEEVGEGAAEMVAAGAVENVRAIVALHVDPDLATGLLAHRSGAFTANCHELRIAIEGLAGHAARPHLAIDPICVAAQFITSVYQFVPRSVDARDPSVVTFGSIRGGASANVIPQQVELMGTIRTLSPATAARVIDRVVQIARGLSDANGAKIEVTVRTGTEAVYNDARVTAVCVRAAGEVVGPAQVEPILLPSMGGEDFSGYLAHVPGCMLRLGVASADRPRVFLHSPDFDLDERALAIGAKVLAHSVVLLSNPLRGDSE